MTLDSDFEFGATIEVNTTLSLIFQFTKLKMYVN
jgi:hypothetical protein